MGDVPVNSNNNQDDEVQKFLQIIEGTYWNCLNSIWDKQPEEFEGYFAKYKDVRKSDTAEHYADLRFLLERSEQGVETVLEHLREGSVYDAADPDAESVSTRAMTDDEIETNRVDSAGTKNHSKKHLKTIRGDKIDEANSSKAHLLPNDEVCNEFWLPELQMILGRTVDVTSAPKQVMEWAARLHTNKLVFGMKHNHYFDDLEYGNILAIPLFVSFEDVGNWKYKQAYEMLIVCDSSGTYKQIGISGLEEHVEMATGEDVQRATTLLSEATKILADSLLANSDYYDRAGNASNETKKKMIQRMKDTISKKDGKEKCEVFVPTRKLGDSEDPRLYKVKFGDLFADEEGKKYIPDPLLLLIKAAVNLSAHHYSKTCKLLPACMSVSSEESEAPLLILQSPEGSSDFKTAISEIRIVSHEEDDDVSACSDITYSSDPEANL